MNKISKLIQFLILFLVGGSVYVMIELLWRGRSYPSMFILGGICFYLIGLINEKYPWDMPLISQMFISSIIVTTFEFIFGVILNIILKLGIWDYSQMPYNLCGQICLLFSILWFLLSAVAIVVDDFIRWKWFGEKKPKYHIFYSHCEDLHKNDH